MTHVFGRFRRRIAVGAVIAGTLGVAAVAVPAQAAPAQAAATPGWSIAENFGGLATGGASNLTAITASSAKSAWAAEDNDLNALVLDKWTGSTWEQLGAPAPFTNASGADPVNDFIIGSTGADDVWTFPRVDTTQYGLHWNGSSWSKVKFAADVDIFSAAVFGPKNVWVFGQLLGTGTGLGYGTSYAAHYTGHGWSAVKLPGPGLHVSALGPSDFDVVSALPTSGYALMHWNGTKWQRRSIPVPADVSGYGWNVTGIAAVTATSVWVQESVAGSLNGEPGPAGVALLHWNKGKWSAPVTNTSYYTYAGLAWDGSAGLWLSGYNSQSQDEIINFSPATGAWTYQTPPAISGYTDSVSDFVRIPGTSSAWALGSLEPVSGNGFGENAVLKYSS